MKVFNILSHFRNRNIFISQFDNVEYFRLPNETDESLFNRMPQGQYLEQFKSEYKSLKRIIIIITIINIRIKISIISYIKETELLDKIRIDNRNKRKYLNI